MYTLCEKKERLIQILREMESVLIAFSGGVDSTFLLKTAHDTLGDRAVAVTAVSCLFPANEQSEAMHFCKNAGICQIEYTFSPLETDGFKENPPDRCYLCKKALFSQIRRIAKEKNITYVAEGSNMDDDGDYRPGRRAVEELDIRSPLKEAELTKSDIRSLSKDMNLPTWDKPSLACLASRFVYGETITEEKLRMTDKAEQYLLEAGFRQVRVRMHGKLARIEVGTEELQKMFTIYADINTYLQELGFLYVTLDLGGYRTGNMNKQLCVWGEK